MNGSLLDFTLRVVSGFQRSQGLVLADAVAYYTLLAIVPLFVVLLVRLAHVVDEHRLLDTVASNLQLVIPSQAAAVTEQVKVFLAHREVVGIVGVLALEAAALILLFGAQVIAEINRARIGRAREGSPRVA